MRETLRSELVIAAATIGFGLLLWWAHYQSGRGGFASIGVKEALFIGLAQALALIPGTSRSGITLTAGLWLGLSRRIAAKFSFLLSIPIILGAALLKTKDLLDATEPVAWDAIGIGVRGQLFVGLCVYSLISVLDRAFGLVAICCLSFGPGFDSVGSHSLILVRSPIARSNGCLRIQSPRQT